MLLIIFHLIITSVLSERDAPGIIPNTFIWPLPSNFTKGTTTITVNASCELFQPVSTFVPRTIIVAIRRYCDLTFPHNGVVVKDARFRQLSID